MPGRLIAILLLSVFVPAHAGIFVWTDEKGQRHFGAHPPASQPAFEPVKPQVGYEAKAGAPVASPAVRAASAATEQMCEKAMHWTKIDIPNLREIAGERLKAGKLNQEQHEQTTRTLSIAERELTRSACLTSTGEERKLFECLSRGIGIAFCTLRAPAAFAGVR